MINAIPKLEDYGLAETGFMPVEQPLKRIEGLYYFPWENTMDQFHQLLVTQQLRCAVLNVHTYIPKRYLTSASNSISEIPQNCCREETGIRDTLVLSTWIHMEHEANRCTSIQCLSYSQ